MSSTHPLRQQAIGWYKQGRRREWGFFFKSERPGDMGWGGEGVEAEREKKKKEKEKWSLGQKKVVRLQIDERTKKSGTTQA